MPNTHCCMGACVALAALLSSALAQSNPADSKTTVDPQTVVAIVGDEPILASEVERLVRKATRGQELNRAALPFVQAQVLAEIVSHRLVMSYAKRQNELPTQAELAEALSEFQAGLKPQGKTFEQFLKREGLSEDDVRRQVAWRLVWDKYLAKYLTPERLDAHFRQHRRQFDGTQMLVSHVLLQPPTRGVAQAVMDLVEQAKSIRGEIVSGRTTFTAAAARHSVAPSARTGGQLGWISRRGEMDEAFCRVAFALERGEVSEPVRTRFGVHLIRCDDVRPGDKQLDDVRKEVEEALARELLEKLAVIERKRVAVEYTGKLPYLKRNGEIVLP